MVTTAFSYIKKGGVLLLVATLLTGLVSSSLVKAAQDQLSISISPVIFDLTADPGTTLTNTIKITNVSTTKSQEIVMSVEAFTGTETGEAVVSDTGDPDYSLKDWISFSPADFTMAPGKSQDVTYKIKVPSNAEPGGRYGSILASTPQSSLNTGTGVATVQKVGALVLLRVSGPINYLATIKSFTPAKSLFEHAPINFSMLIHNDSTVHITPKGFVTISNSFGQKVADVPIPERIILPKEDRILEVSWNGPASIGHYTATVLLVYGDKGNQVAATQTFYIFPWKTGIPTIIVVVFLLWFVTARRRRIIEAIRVLAGRK